MEERPDFGDVLGLEAERQELKQMLQRSDDPRRVIAAFQRNKGLKIQSSPSVPLELTDYLEVPRAEVFSGLLHSLSSTLLLKMIPTMDHAKLTGLLEHTLDFLGVPELKAIPIAILDYVEAVPAELVQRVSGVRNMLPVRIKRKIWQVDIEQFRKDVFPIFHLYFKEEEKRVGVRGEDPTLRRKSNPHLQRLLEYVGTSVILYSMLLKLFKACYVKFSVPGFCTLRYELLMAFHDADVREIYDEDPCYRFTWGVDGWIRSGAIDTKRMDDLLGCLMEPGSPWWGDIAMILNAAPVRDLALQNFSTQLASVISRRKLPKDDTLLLFISRLISLAPCASLVMKTREFGFPELNSVFVSDFLPSLGVLLVEDQMQEENVDPPDFDQDLPDLVMSSPAAALTFLEYLLGRVEVDDVGRVQQLIHVVSMLEEGLLVQIAFFEKLFCLLAQKEWGECVRVTLDEGVMRCVEVSSFSVLEQFMKFLKKVIPKHPVPNSEMYVARCQALGNTVGANNRASYEKRMRKLNNALAVRSQQHL